MLHKLLYGLNMFVILPLGIKELSWHSGASVLISTLKYAFNDLMDMLVVIAILLCGIGAMASTWFGDIGGYVIFKVSSLRTRVEKRCSNDAFNRFIYVICFQLFHVAKIMRPCG